MILLKLKLTYNRAFFFLIKAAILVSAVQRSVMIYRLNQDIMNKISLCIIMMILLIGCLKSKMRLSYKETIAILISVISYWLSHSLACLYIVSVCLAAKNCDQNKIVSSCCWGNLIAIVVVFLANISGLFMETSFVRGDTGELRYSFGFTHPNTFCVYLLAFIVSYYAVKNKYKIQDFLPIFIAVYISAVYTKSITASLALFAILAYLIVARTGLYKVLRSKWMFGLIKTAVPLIVLFIVVILYIAYRFDSLIFLSNLGKTANLRLLYAHQALNEYGVSLMGQEISTYGSSFFLLNSNSTQRYFTIDSLYILLLVRDGLFATIVIIGSILQGLTKAVKQKKSYYIYIIIDLVIYSVMESGIINYAFTCIYTFGVAGEQIQYFKKGSGHGEHKKELSI